MKTIPLRLIIATALIIVTVYSVSVILTKEMVTVIILLTVFALFKFIVRTTLYIVFQVVKWAVIIAVIGLLITSLF